jgi:predicted FMN-binding regulatory protein PaiB
MATVDALGGWKYRAALVLGHIKSIDGDKLTITPVSKPESEVKRKREKVLLESELDPADVEEAMKRHGHMARTATKSRSAKAQAVGLDTPSQARATRCDALRCELAAARGLSARPAAHCADDAY